MNQLKCRDRGSKPLDDCCPETCIRIPNVVGRPGHTLSPDPAGNLGAGSGDCHRGSLGHCPLELDLATVKRFAPGDNTRTFVPFEDGDGDHLGPGDCCGLGHVWEVEETSSSVVVCGEETGVEDSDEEGSESGSSGMGGRRLAGGPEGGSEGAEVGYPESLPEGS